MPDTLPAFPVDDVTLAAIEHALGGAYTVDTDEDGHHTHRLVGADYSLHDLLDFLSGYDPSQVIPATDADGYEMPGVTEYPGVLYHVNDIIKALIAEVRRLRTDSDG